MITAQRLINTKEYYFSRKLKEVKAMIAAGKPVINMGIGSPDIAAPKVVEVALAQAMQSPVAHQYQGYSGLPELRVAMARFYEKHYQVSLDFTHEVLPLMGSKEGIMHISMAYLDKGDAVLVPNPGYPTYAAVANLLEAQIINYELDEKNNWLPDFDQLSKQDLSKVKLMWVNYPHMPTGAKGSLQCFEQLIAFAKANKILIVNDNPYSFILNDAPMSILSLKEARGVAIELNSLSKTFNMAGWRVGMVVGDKNILKHILTVKSNMDSGMFYGIQQGAIAALGVTELWFEKMNGVYARRRKLVWELADALNCTYQKTAVGMFVWAKIPAGESSKQLVDRLLYDYHIFSTPGDIFGTRGVGYIRFSLCVEEQKIIEAIKRL